jgi:hypothetical protein
LQFYPLDFGQVITKMIEQDFTENEFTKIL